MLDPNLLKDLDDASGDAPLWLAVAIAIVFGLVIWGVSALVAMVARH